MIALYKIGALERYIKWVKKFYSDFEVILKIGKKEIAIKYRYGVRQGDNLPPMLFIIAMQLVVEDIIENLIKIKISLLIIKYSLYRYKVLRLHKKIDLNKMINKIIIIFTCIDNGVVLFNSKEELEISYKIICATIAK